MGLLGVSAPGYTRWQGDSFSSLHSASLSCFSSVQPWVVTPLVLQTYRPPLVFSEGAAIDADQETDIIEVKSSSSTDPAAPAAAAKWVVKHDIIGNPMKMVAVPTHFFKVSFRCCGQQH